MRGAALELESVRLRKLAHVEPAALELRDADALGRGCLWEEEQDVAVVGRALRGVRRDVGRVRGRQREGRRRATGETDVRAGRASVGTGEGGRRGVLEPVEIGRERPGFLVRDI